MSKFNVTTEPVPFCGETNNLNLGVLPNGKLSDVQHRLEQKIRVALHMLELRLRG